MRNRRGGSSGPRQRQVRIQLDPIIWQALQDIAAQQARTVHDLVTEIAHDAVNLAIHVYIEEFYRTDTTGSEDPDPNPGISAAGRF
jgi:predicted DNA-binding ribbon-helix-helix protein